MRYALCVMRYALCVSRRPAKSSPVTYASALIEVFRGVHGLVGERPEIRIAGHDYMVDENGAH